MASLDERAAVLRGAMVDGIASEVGDRRVIDAMRRVPRHRFVERFVGAPPGEHAWSMENMREWVVDDDADDDTLALVHDAHRALPAPGASPFALKTSLSAPNLVASMLATLDLGPGTRVLEIGAGSGYNAALIAELVGDPALVTTVDIDSSLIEPARRRLGALGYAGVEVVEGDGDDGVPVRAPYDRIIGTVGCNDLSPAWFDQLASGGSMLIPVRHGGAHPLVLARGDLTSSIAGPSGFVSVQGRQDQPSWWTSRHGHLPDGLEWTPIPNTHPAVDRNAMWDAAFYVAVRDRRSGGPSPMLVDDDSVAVLDPGRGYAQHGPDGPALLGRLTTLVGDWVAMGAPSMRAFTATWQPRSTDAPAADDARDGPWIVPRIHHDERIVLETVSPG